MIKKTIKFTDYNGMEREEDFYFNLSKAELAEMQLSTTGGLEQMIQEIIQTKDIPKIMELFKKMIKASYGKKSPDGRRFMKSQEILDDFMQTEAYSNLFMELSTNDEVAAEFVKGIIPDDLRKEYEASLAKNPELKMLTNK